MKTKTLSNIMFTALLALLVLNACSATHFVEFPWFGKTTELANIEQKNVNYLKSGSILLSHKIPKRLDSQALSIKQETLQTQPKADDISLMAPLIGFFPPAETYIPAENETWIEIISSEKKIVLHKGRTPIKEMRAEGDIPIEPGEYFLQHKQKNPLWYAPDTYFTRRNLTPPEQGNRLKYRKGALGKFAIYPTTSFPIHCAPVWSEDVGGLRVSLAELSSIYHIVPLGAPVVIR
jgi:hypothetical protein